MRKGVFEANGGVYDGEWQFGTMFGHGTLTTQSHLYTGEEIRRSGGGRGEDGGGVGEEEGKMEKE